MTFLLHAFTTKKKYTNYNINGRGEVATSDFLPVLGIGYERKSSGCVPMLPGFGPFLIFSPCLALGTPEQARVMLAFRPNLHPRESSGEVPTSDFSRDLHGGPTRRQGLCTHVAWIWALSDFFPVLALGTPQLVGVM